MKPTKEIIGLRIISISDGTQVGVVKDIVINPQGKSLDFVIIDQAVDYFGAKVIAFTDILGIGEFAVTIPHPGVIQDVAQNTEAQNLLKQDTRVLGTKVLTKKGQLIGEVKEVLIDVETGHIAACLFESDDQMREVGVEQVITLGKDLLIVEAEQTVNQRIEEHMRISDEVDFTSKMDFIEVEDSIELVPNIEMNSIEENLIEVEDFEEQVNFIEESEYVEEKEAGFNLFEQRQLQYFIGKRVEKDIILDNTEVLRAGERITPEVVSHITTRSTLMEVTSHLQKN